MSVTAGSADAVREELEGLEQFLAAYCANQFTDQQKHETLSALVGSLVSKIYATPTMTFEEATRLTTALGKLQQSGTLQPAHHESLSSAVVRRLQAANEGARVKTRRHPQTLTSAEWFLTAGDWQILQDRAATLQTKLSCLHDRMQKLCLTNPSEATLKVLAGIILCASGADGVP
eukprot:11973911-Alexandrium_andersonii.AAC.2